MSKALKGMRCLVTGGGSGIGAGIARCLARSGASVAVLGRRKAALQRTVASIEALRQKAFAVAADVTEPAALGAAVRRVQKALGGLDVLVNNAGKGGGNACALPGPDRWDEIVRTNLDGVFFTTRAALPHLADGGRIVNISSVLGRFGVPGYTAYCASKAGILGLVRALAVELAPQNVQVNALCPGWVNTAMAQEGIEGIAKKLGVSKEQFHEMAMSQVPLRRMSEPEDVAGLVAWLCSPDARGVTGQGLDMNGGAWMG